MRDWGVAAALADLPGWVETLLAGITMLGAPLTLLSVATLVYWINPPELKISNPDGARLAVATLVGLALVPATKATLAEPRPPMALWAITTDGYGIPSGHATAAATFGVATALLSTRGRPLQRWTLAAGFFGLIGFTRVALGVHYAGDVVLGTILGAGTAVGVVELTRRRLRPGLVIAVGLATAGAIVTGLEPTNPMTRDATVALGGSLGATIAWLGLDRVGAHFETPDGVTILLGSGAVLVGGGLVVGIGGTGSILLGSAVAGLTVTGVPRIRGIP
jgi:membrane-associated phospholipid phosphatase